jgi:hypothetical protein
MPSLPFVALLLWTALHTAVLPALIKHQSQAHHGTRPGACPVRRGFAARDWGASSPTTRGLLSSSVFFFSYAVIKKSVDLIGMRWGNCTIRMSLEHKLHIRERKEGTEKEKIEGKFNPNFEYSVGVVPDGNRSKCLWHSNATRFLTLKERLCMRPMWLIIIYLFIYLFTFTGQEAGLFQFMPRTNVPSAWALPHWFLVDRLCW